ncbi:MAG TPA: class I SAM-dependent methyltransferase [Candidatus Limnocylindria bacterium]|nr:class I SAM-dependent methyltransferase [Candidatus Limnocylindria bacterium]
MSYDDIAEGYARYWGPTILPEAVRVLDLIAPAVAVVLDGGANAATGTPAMLDVGAGTGALSIEALRRWPELSLIGIDPSGGMLDVARREAAAQLTADAAARFRTEVAFADELPFEDGSIDVAVSSFVLQLVADRGAVMREVRRVLKPGATFAWVSWLRTDRAYEPDRVANAALDDAGFDPPEPDGRPGDLASVAAAAAGMRRAGFRDVQATAGELAHEWTPEGYVDFFSKFDEQSLFDELDAKERAAIEAKILRGVRRLTADERTLRLPTVSVVGRVPGG